MKNKKELLYGLLYVLLTLALAGCCYAVDIPNPSYILVLVLFIATIRRGYAAAIGSGVVIVAFAFFFFSENHDFLTFSKINREKIIVIACVTLIHMVVCCILYAQNQKRAEMIEQYAREKNSISRQALKAFSGSYMNVYVINTANDTATVIKQDGYVPQGLTYKEGHILRLRKAFDIYVNARVAEEDRERMHHLLQPEIIEQNLSDKQECSFLYYVVGARERHNYEVRFIRTDQEKCFVVGFANADNLMAEERQRQKLYAEVERLKDRNKLFQNMVATIARLVDAKDIYTAKHSARVTEYSLLIGRELGLSDEEMENLERSAMLHDIGKIAVPDGILCKKGKLSKEEYQIMKSHPVFGYEILRDMDPDSMISEGARYHHERYDGKGYPEGLKGEDIPLFGRIIGVADAYDAMSSNRIYRPKCDEEYILNEFRKGRGTQFDPQICDIFLSLLEEKKIASEEPGGDKVTLEELYESFGGRYFIVQQRFKKDERILEYLGDFLKDEEFGKLKKALEEGDEKTAFRAVHTLKSISMSLDFVNLEKICIELTENLRDAPINKQTPELFEQLEKEYTEVCSAIRRLREQS